MNFFREMWLIFIGFKFDAAADNTSAHELITDYVAATWPVQLIPK